MNNQSQHWRIPAGYLKLFLQHVVTLNLPLESVLKGTALNLDELLQSDQTVSLGETRQVMANVSSMMEPGWHLALARHLTLSSHGPLGFAVVTAPNLRASVDAMLRFFGVRGPFLWLAGAVEGDEFVLRLHETTDMGKERLPLVELAILSLQGLIERPLGREIRGARIAFAYPAPVYRAKVEDVFHAQLNFDANRHKLSFPASWLDEPCVMFDAAMHRYLLVRCEEELFAALTRPDKLPSLADIAVAQHVSPRTLIRRLKRADTSYQAILKEVRKTLSADYLLHSDMSVASIPVQFWPCVSILVRCISGALSYRPVMLTHARMAENPVFLLAFNSLLIPF